MAAGSFTFYKPAKKYLSGTIALGADTFVMSLHTSASNAGTATLSVFGSVSNQVTAANGYASGGKTLSSVTWAAGTSAGSIKFNAAAVQWRASGGTIPNVKFAVIRDNSTGTSTNNRKLLCYAQLSTSQFTVSSGNTMTVTPASTGIFTLT